MGLPKKVDQAGGTRKRSAKTATLTRSGIAPFLLFHRDLSSLGDAVICHDEEGW